MTGLHSITPWLLVIALKCCCNECPDNTSLIRLYSSASMNNNMPYMTSRLLIDDCDIDTSFVITTITMLAEVCASGGSIRPDQVCTCQERLCWESDGAAKTSMLE